MPNGAVLLFEKRERILDAARRYGLADVRIFGSFARGEADEESDIDFVVRLESGRSPLGLGGFLMEMRDLFGRRVDVATEAMLKPRYRERVLSESVAV